jgi:soluble lytic murein transglycosylase-like protein
MFHAVPMECINQAVVAYAIPASLIMAIIYVEGGTNGLRIRNTNGSFDYGVMQVNSSWLPEIAKQFAYTPNDLQYNACKNVMAGSWILRQNLNQQKRKSIMYAVGSYHSLTPNLNYIYSIQVLSAYQTIQKVFAGDDAKCGVGQIC